jgi:hypothetical protein
MLNGFAVQIHRWFEFNCVHQSPNLTRLPGRRILDIDGDISLGHLRFVKGGICNGLLGIGLVNHYGVEHPSILL